LYTDYALGMPVDLGRSRVTLVHINKMHGAWCYGGLMCVLTV